CPAEPPIPAMRAVAQSALRGPAVLAGMHCCRSPAELRSAFADAMQAVVGTVGYAVLLNEEAGGRHRVEVAGGDGCPLVGDDYATSAQWPVPAEQRLPLRYGSHVLGELLVGEPLPEACAGEVQ